MFSYRIEIYENKTWTQLKSWSRPFTDGTALDDTLDAGAITLSLSDRQESIKPFTKLRIIITDDGIEKERIYRLVASSKRVRRVYAPSLKPLYDWQIQTIELTKELERRFIGTMTVTKTLSTDYATGGSPAPYKRTAGTDLTGDGFSVVSAIKQPIDVGGTLYVPSTDTMFQLPENSVLKGNWYINTSKTLVKDENGNVLFTSTPPGEAQGGSAPAFSYLPTREGNLKIVYDMDIIQWIAATSTTQHYSVEYTFTVNVFEQIQPKTQPTITSVCERLLSSGITRRDGIDEQEYVLDETFAEEYADVESPEFSFTNCTLFEALAQVGGYIHAIPRLIPRLKTDDTHYKVTFDKLGGNEQAPAMPPMVYQDHAIDINDWCGTLDCPAQNLCNSENVDRGAITELGDDYITCRTEDGQIEINADNVIIRTSMPIQQLVKLECGFIPEYNNGKTPVGDITAYVYENAEYSTLSSYWGAAYPYSKAWALCYAQGDNKITGLSFVLQKSTSVSQAFEKYAIANIIEAKTGISLSSLSLLWGKWMRQLAFKVTYVPIVSTRVKQIKPTIYSVEEKNELVYNQGASVAETSYYGEKMRGAIARLGQDVEQRTYDIFNYAQLPKCGQLLDGKYIARVDTEYDIIKIRTTVTLTKNFNQLAQYVGLNSNYRLYDISEKQSAERFVNYSEKILVGNTTDDDNAIARSCIRNSHQMFYQTIYQSTLDQIREQPTRVVYITPCDSSGNALLQRQVALPVAAFPFGTSLCFSFAFLDNYGAGYQSSDDYENEVNKAAQRLVPYTDVYGEIGELKFSMGESGWTPSISDQSDDGAAMLYPQLNGSANPQNVSISTKSNNIIVKKDSREQLNVIYQAHFVATRQSVVVGSGIARNNPRVGKSYLNNIKRTVVLWLKRPINALSTPTKDDVLYADLRPLKSIEETENGATCVRVWGNPASETAYAYAVCHALIEGESTPYQIELLFGENFENGIAPGAEVPPIYLTPVANDFDGIVEYSWRVKKNAKAYKEKELTTEIGVYALSRPIKQDNIFAGYARVDNGKINKNGYANSEFFQDSLPTLGMIRLAYGDNATDITVWHREIGGKNRLLAIDTDYTIDTTSGKTMINLTEKNMLVLGVTVEYTCHVDTAIPTATSYAKPDDVIYG